MKEQSRRIVRTLKLSEPIHDAGEEITELKFGRPKGRLFRLIDNLQEIGGEQILEVIGELCDIGSEACDELDWDDVIEAGAIVGELLRPKNKKKSPSRASGRRKTGEPR